MTIPEIKKKWINEVKLLQIEYKHAPIHRKAVISTQINTINSKLTDLDTLPECNGLKIDYTKQTCTSCNCKNHD